MVDQLIRQLVMKKNIFVVLGSKENQGNTPPGSEKACQQENLARDDSGIDSKDISDVQDSLQDLDFTS
ncbi:hypothetical protein I79_014223 [Cricetulus griseus]|uniref:Uncharacterized protein n=1 Tax=Cricetulus griseus TaxID=10029 RepID=G3HTJ5_CRIGR|nr:hypothetical protein I79_014223 [Cricetulus griseus]